MTPGAAIAVETGKPLPASVQLVFPEIATAPKQALQAAVTAMVRDAVAKQNGLAPLMADIEAALTRPDVPQPVRAAAAQLLGLRVETNAPVTAPDIKAAVLRSGIAGDPLTLQPAQPGGVDLKAALTNLKEALTNWVAKEQGVDPALAQGKPLAPASVPLPLPQRANVPPPHRLAPTIAQAPLPASLPDEASAREAAQHLLNKTDGALARQTLLQIASLPDESVNRAEQAGPRLTLDIPLALAQGTGVAQLRVEQEPSRRDGPDIRPLWRANFSIDVEPIGPGACLDRAVRRTRRGHALCRARRERRQIARWLAGAGSEPERCGVRDRRIALPVRRAVGAKVVARPVRGSGVMSDIRQPLAVALKYEKPNAPRVTAMGRGDIARRIIEEAEKHGVPISENPALAQALSHVEVEQEIPENLYRAVAEVLTYILRVSGQIR